jgi:hypothetical protein
VPSYVQPSADLVVNVAYHECIYINPVEPAQAYYVSVFGDKKDQKLDKRHQKLASALVHVGATSADAKSITVRSAEFSYPEGSTVHSHPSNRPGFSSPACGNAMSR